MDSINILSKKYKLVHESTLTNSGTCNHGSLVISYRDQSEDQLTDTILHECLHSLDYACRLGLEERQIHALSALIIDLLRTNPELAKRITKNHD